MNNRIFDRIGEFMKRHRRHKLWQRTMSVMVAVCVFCTTYALILPAITQENGYMCGIDEHTHDESCFERVVLENICETDLHEHEDACFDAEGKLLCGYADFVIHTHDEICYSQEGELRCTLMEVEEHVHDEACYFEREEVIEEIHRHTDECYEIRQGDLICETEEADGHAHNADCERTTELLVCGTIEYDGHSHSDDCHEITQSLVCAMEEEEAHLHEGDCFGDDGEIGCPLEETDGHSHGDDCYEEQDEIICGEEEDAGHSHTDECYEIVTDIDCGYEEKEAHSHTDECYEEAEELVCDVHVVEIIVPIEDGVFCGTPQIAVHTHIKGCFENDEVICGMLEAEEHVHTEECFPDGDDVVCTEEHEHDELCTAKWNNVCEFINHAHSEDCMPIYDKAFVYEDERYIMNIHVNSDALIPRDTEIEISLVVEGDDYKSFESKAIEQAPGDYTGLSVYRIEFISAGEEVELREANVKIEATVKAEEAVLFEMEAEEALNTEVVHITSMQMIGEDIVDAATTTLENEEEESTFLMELGASRLFALARSVEAYPLFNVQYYANMLRYSEKEAGDVYIPVINTAASEVIGKGSYGEGGHLPVNGNGTSSSPTDRDIFELALASTGETEKYQLKMHLEPTEIYEAQENVMYSNSLKIDSLDILSANSHYALDFIRTQSTEQLEKQTLAGVTGLDEAYWTKYSISEGGILSDEYYFTNVPEAEEKDGKLPIVISEGMTVRYVYYPTEEEDTVETPANFFDYDISDSNYKSGSVNYMYTDARGINSHEDSDNNTAYLAFGNSNTNTGYGKVTWTDTNNVSTTPNQYNSTGYMGCTFGIVADYDYPNKTLIYQDTIDAPCFFTHEATGVAGKTPYMYTDTSHTTMNFSRYGDTYTLTSISGNQNIYASGLDTFTRRWFNNNTKAIISNDFWPMDNVWNKDFHFGDSATYSAGTKKYSNAAKTATGNLPLSDDNLEHNSYFGLQYSVDFHLDGTYDGPLEYLFYGDDDMWVFLTDRTDPENPVTNLIADIGGVHSSVGSYTNLWDWVPNTEERHLGKGEYTLTFFYTERGASGSSCFMQFTIPHTIGVPITSMDTGSISVGKELTEGEYDGTFAFDYTIGENMYYPYTVYEKGEDGSVNEVSSGSLLYTGEFRLEAGQYIVIADIPLGTAYSISEQRGEYSNSWTYPVSAVLNGSAVEGEVLSTTRVELICENTLFYKLPETGGSGRELYVFGGLLLAGMAALLLMYKEKCRRRMEKQS